MMVKEDTFEDEVTLFDDTAKAHFERLTNDEAIKSGQITDELPRGLVTPTHKINNPADDPNKYRRARARIF